LGIVERRRHGRLVAVPDAQAEQLLKAYESLMRVVDTALAEVPRDHPEASRLREFKSQFEDQMDFWSTPEADARTEPA
jgi:hypothetical protein